MATNTSLFYYPVSIVRDTNPVDAAVAPAVTSLPMRDDLVAATLIDDEGPSAPAGLYVKDGQRWRLALPFKDFCYSIIRGDTLTLYVNKVASVQAPAGSTVYVNGKQQAGLNIVAGTFVYAARTPPASGGGSAVASVNGMTGVVTINASNLPGLAAVAQTNDYNSLNNKPSAYSLPPASSVALGGVMVPSASAISVDAAGNIEVKAATSTLAGAVKIGTGLDATVDGTLSVASSVTDNRATASTSLFTGGVLSINSGDNSKLDVSAGTGVFLDYTDPVHPIGTVVDFGPATALTLNNLGTQPSTYIGVNAAASFVQQAFPFTAEQRRTIIPLGLAVHSNNVVINVINQISAPNRAALNQMQDFIEAVGPLNTGGNVYSPNGANLSVNKSAGAIFKYGCNFPTNPNNPHSLSVAQQTALTFRYRQANSAEGADTSVIVPGLWDNEGTLTPVGIGNFTIQRIFMFQSGLTRIQYGQAVYGTMSAALDAISREAFTVEANIAANGIARGVLVVRGNATDLTNTAQARFIDIPKFGSNTGAGTGLAFGYTPENVLNKDAVDGYVGLTQRSINFKNALGTFTSLLQNNNTAARTYMYPDYSGEVAMRHLAPNVQSANYTLTMEDIGRFLYHPGSDASPRTFTIPSNASVPYPVGTELTFVNESTSVIDITVDVDTLKHAGSGSTGVASLPGNGIARALKTTATSWIIQGTGIG